MPTMTILCVLYEDLYGVEEAPALGIIRCAGNFAGRVAHHPNLHSQPATYYRYIIVAIALSRVHNTHCRRRRLCLCLCSAYASCTLKMQR
jgi:hypothetical protein